MADLSNLFAPPQVQRRATPFDYAGPKAAEYKRAIVMNEAMKRDLAPDDGEPFFKFVGKRLFELGDIQGAMAVNQQATELLSAQAAGQQQQFENELSASKFNLDVSRFNREGAKQPKRSEIMTGAELGVTDPALKDASIEVVYGDQGQIVDYQVLSKGGVNVNLGNELSRKENLMRLEAKVSGEISQDETDPILNEYIALAEKAEANPTPENIQVYLDARIAAGKALATKREKGQRVTDDDVRLAMKSLPTPATLMNLVSGGKSFAKQVESFRKIESIGSPKGSGQDARKADIAAKLGVDPSQIEIVE